MKKIAIVALATVLCVSAAFAQTTTATKYYVAHQGGYIGEATVTIDAAGKVVDATWSEWQGPGGWAAFNSPDGKSLVGGAIVRVPDPLANASHADPAIRGYMFYIYNLKPDGTYIWSQYTPGEKGFALPARQFERDFEGVMGNPIRAAAYARAAREDKLVNVTITGLTVTVGKPASQTVHYGHMDKANKASIYMPIAEGSIGYRYNYKATIDFFKANPTANYAAFTMKKTKVTLVENKNVDQAPVAGYKAAEDTVYVVADAVSGATFSDFPHYCIELQTAYMMALAQQKVTFKK